MKYDEVLKGIPENLKIKFDKMNQLAKHYTLNRILGFNKSDSARNAGSDATTPSGLSSTAKSLEDRNPAIEEIIEWATTHDIEKELLSNESSFAKTLAQKKKESQLERIKEAVNDKSLTPTMADSIDFYRRVANGSIKTYITTETYDANNKLVKKQRVIRDDVTTKMAAREKLDRILGLNAIQNLGQVKVGAITVNIVDASKKEDEEDTTELDFQPNAVVKDEDGTEYIDGGTEIEIEPKKVEEKPKNEKQKNDQLPLYYIDEKGNRRRRPSWER